jgi:hypothetical protein
MPRAVVGRRRPSTVSRVTGKVHCYDLRPARREQLSCPEPDAAPLQIPLTDGPMGHTSDELPTSTAAV